MANTGSKLLDKHGKIIVLHYRQENDGLSLKKKCEVDPRM